MKYSVTSLTLGLCLVAGLAFVQPASAEPNSLPALGFASGQVTSFDPVNGVQIVEAAGKGSILGPHVNHITTFLDFDTGQAWGFFENTADNGSTSIGGVFTATFQPIEGTPWIAFCLLGTFEDGSGRLEGASGEVEVVAFQNLQTGEIEYTYSGVFEFN